LVAALVCFFCFD